MKILAEAPDYCHMPAEFNRNKEQCVDKFSVDQALRLAFFSSILPLICLFCLYPRRKKNSRNQFWNPLAGALWGVLHILITIFNALTMGYSHSAPITLQFFQLLLTAPRFTWWELLPHLTNAFEGNEESKKAAADAIMMDTTIGTLSLGFLIDLYLRMTSCDGMATLGKTSALLLPVLGLVSSLLGSAVTGLIMARSEVKALWLLPSFVGSVTMSFFSVLFWCYPAGVTRVDCKNDWEVAPSMAFQLFLPIILACFRIFTRCLPGVCSSPTSISDDLPTLNGEDSRTTTAI